MQTIDGRGTDDRHRGRRDVSANSGECCCGGALLAELFVWTVIAALFLSVMIAVTYLALDFCSSAPPPQQQQQQHHDAVPIASPLHAPKRAIINVTTREYCSTVSKDLYSLEQLGYMDADRRVSRLLGLRDVGADDVHYVLANDTHVPLLFTCSLESVLRTMQANRSRVNVFVVFGIEFGRPVLDEQHPVSGGRATSKILYLYHYTHVPVERSAAPGFCGRPLPHDSYFRCSCSHIESNDIIFVNVIW